MNDIREVLNERGVNYGSFAGQSELSQLLKKTIDIEIAKRGKSLNSYQKEALEMILHKIARIINGNPDYADSWLDISGYASLVAAQLNKKSTSGASTIGGALTGAAIGGALTGAAIGGALTGADCTFSGNGTFNGTGQVKLPAGTTAQRSGSPTDGMICHKHV